MKPIANGPPISGKSDILMEGHDLVCDELEEGTLPCVLEVASEASSDSKLSEHVVLMPVRSGFAKEFFVVSVTIDDDDSLL